MLESVLLGLAILAAAIFGLRWAVRRANVLLSARARHGELQIVRSSLRANVIQDLEDVVRERKLDGLEIRIVREAKRARVDVVGEIDPGSLQRLRNVVGNATIPSLAKQV